jgi:hypothetical protein
MSNVTLAGEGRPFSTEEDLRGALIEVLQKRGLEPVVEVPFLGRSLDMAYLCADGSITAIEIKRRPNHVRAAISQARICLLGANRVYVCTPEYNMTNRTKALFKELGIGVMFLQRKPQGNTVQYSLAAGSNRFVSGTYAAILRKAISSRYRRESDAQ